MKKYNVSPILRPGTKTFVATFRQASGVRVTRSLETSNKDEADKICLSLRELWNHAIKRASDVPAMMEVNAKAHALYFNETLQTGGDVHIPADQVGALRPRVHLALEAYDRALHEILEPIIYQQLKTRDENETLRADLATCRRDLNTEIEKREAIERSILGRAAATAARVPAIATSFAAFKKHIGALPMTQHNAKLLESVTTKFLASLPPERKSMADVRVEDISKFLDDQSSGEFTKRAARRDALRRRVGRFVNWAAEQSEYPSQMLRVDAVKKDDILRERGEIHWHELDVVEAAVKTLPDDYWKALVSTLAYAGLQLAELVWLRVSDVDLGKGQIFVKTVDDPDDKQVRHLLKTEHRKRVVNIDPVYLAPRLKAFVAAGHCGKNFFFAMPDGMEGKARKKSGGSAERWLVPTLSTILRGHVGGKRRKATEGLLPDGMNAKSLRRTFGSLLLRSKVGCSYPEVAAAMGNTEEVVREHYAKLKGSEVTVNFGVRAVS